MARPGIHPAVRVGLRALLTLGFLLPGVTKFLPQFGWVGRFAGWGYPAWFVTVIGSLEILGAAALWIPRVRQYAVALLGVIMLGALYTSATHPHMTDVLRPAIFLVLLGVLGWSERVQGLSAKTPS